MEGSAAAFDQFNSLSLGVTLEESQIRRPPGTLAIQVKGHIETGNALRFQEALNELISGRSDMHRLCLDVSQVSYVSSMGIGALAAVHQRMAEKNGELVLHRPSPRLKEIFAQLGFSEIFTLSDAACGDEAPAGPRRAAFPLALPCPHCKSALRVSRPGRFRCQSCGSIFTVDPAGNAS
jgi:anti-sigma B factor antagonist